MSTWSGIRNKLENEYLAQSLRGHIQYFAVSYSKCPDHKGRFALRYDGKEIFKTDFFRWYMTVCANKLKIYDENPDMSLMECWKTAKKETINNGEFEPNCFYRAFDEFDNQSIEESLNSENAIVRMLAVLDRRVGKRRLISMKDKIENESDWIKCVYYLRMNAENIILNKD